jgi:hypothetical protein
VLAGRRLFNCFGGERFWRKLFENCGRVCFSVTDKRRGERRVIGRADIFKVGSEDTTYTSTSRLDSSERVVK